MAVQYNKKSNPNSKPVISEAKAKRNNSQISKEAINLFNKYEKNNKSLSQTISNVLSYKNGFSSFITDSKLTDETLIKFLRNTNYATKNYETYKQYLKDTAAPSTNSTPPPNPTPPSKKSGNFLSTIKTSLSRMGIEAAISFAAETVISSLSDAIQRRKRLEESGKNITNNFGSLQDNYSQDSSTLSALQSEYDTLSEGVDSFGKNLSLTNDEYSRYKDIMSQISAIMPDMAMRYDSQGNAVGALTGKIKDLNKEYQKAQREKVRDLFNQKDENGNNIYDVMENAETESETNPFLKEGKRILDDYADMFDSFKEGDFMGGLKKLLSNSILNNPYSLSSGLGYHLYNIVSDSTTESFDTQIKELTKDIESGKYQGTELGEKQGKLFELQQKQKENYNIWKTYASGYAQLYDPDNDGNSNFFDLDEETQGFLTTFFANMSPDFIEENGLTSQAAISQFVSQWIDGLEDENSEISKAFQRLQDFDIDTKDMTPKEIDETVNSLIYDLLIAMNSSGMNIKVLGAATSFKESSGLQIIEDNAKKYKNNLDYFNTKEEKVVQEKGLDNKVRYVKKEEYDQERQQELTNWSKNSNVTDEELESLKDKGYNAKSSIDELNIALNELRNDSKKELVPKDFSTVWDSLDSESKDTLLNTANSCELTGDKIKELAKNNKNLDAAFKASGMSADEFARSVREANIDNLDNDIDVYEDALQKMRDGKSLSAEETAAIISKDNSLASSVTKTKDGYKIEESALLSVINASKEKYNVVVTNEILQTETVIKNTKKRIKAYKAELESAQAAITARQSEYESLINSGEYAGKEDEVSRAILGNPQAVDDYAASKKLPKKIKKEQKRLKKLNKDLQKLRKSLGKVSNSSSSPAETNQKQPKQTIDWIERRLGNLQKVIDLTAAKFQNIFKIGKQKNNLDKQIKTTKQLIKEYGLAAEKYQTKANKIATGTKVKGKKGKKKVKNKLSKSIIKKVKTGKLTKKTKPSSLIKAYGSEKAEQIQSYIDYNDKAQSAKKSKEEQIAKKRELKQQKLQLDVDLYNERISRAEAKEAIAIGAKKKNASVNKQIKNIQLSYDKQIAIAALTKGAKSKAEIDRLNYEKQKKITDLKVHQIDNIKKDYENKISPFDNAKQKTQNEVSLLEAKGRIVTANYYRKQNDQETNKRNTLQNELKELQGKLNSGTFTKYSDEWYQLQSDIQSVENSIHECDVNIVENSKKLGELHDAMLEDIAANNTRMASEADFLAGLMGSVLTDEDSKGLTKEGLGVLGTYGIGLETAEKNADTYAKERVRLEKLLSSGSYGRTNDEYQSEKSLRDKIAEVAQKQQEYTKTAYDYETKIADLMKENYQAQLDYMKKIIDAKKNVLSLEKDLYDYERNISDQTKNIAVLEKQYAALQGDDSEEGRAKRSSLQASIDEARQELQDTEYDKYISDQQNMLDNLYTECEDLMNNLFKDQNQLLEEGIKVINENGTTIKGVVDSYADSYGYNYTEDFSSVMTALGSEGTIVTSMKGALNGEDSSSIAKVLVSQADRIIQAYGGNDNNNGGDKKEPTKPSSSGFTVTKPDGSKASGQHTTEWTTGGSTVMDDLAKKNAEDFITDKDNLKEPKKGKKKSQYSDINQVVWERNKKKKKKVLKEGKIEELAGILGIKYNGASKSGNLYKRLKQLKVKGFKHGGIAKLVKSQGEDGLAMVRNGEGLISPENVAELQKFVKVIPTATDLLNNMKDIPIMPNLPTPSNTFGDIHFDKIELPNVQDVDDFVTALQTDKKVQRALGVSVHDLMTKGRITSNIQRL